MSSTATVPIVAPNGEVGDVPYARMQDAIAAGGKPGVTIKSPDGKFGVIPSNRMGDAVKAGGTIVPLENQETQHPGFWATLASDAENLGKGIASAGGTALRTLGGDPHAAQEMMESTARVLDTDPQRKAAGYGPVYRAAAPLGGLAGVDVPTMEAHAAHGDVAAVRADAVTPLAALGVSEAAVHGGPTAAKTAQPYFDAVKDAVSIKGARTAIANAADTGAAVLGNDVTGMISPRAAHAGKMLGKIADLVRPAKPEPSFPGAPLPEHPGTFPGAPEPTGTPEQINPSLISSARTLPGQIPPEIISPPAVAAPTVPVARSGMALPAAPVGAELSELPATGAKPLAQSGEALGNIPSKALTELPINAVNQAIGELGTSAPITALTDRANRIALKSQLEEQLNQAVGYKPPALEPGKPIYQPKAPIPIPEGMTPVESSALRSYHYDPESQTFTAQMRSGSMYKWAEVTPEEAQEFAQAKSKGTALADIRNNHVNTQANYGQGWLNRQPIQRSASPTDIAPQPESAPPNSENLVDLLQKSLEQVRGKNATLAPSGQSNAVAQTAETNARPQGSSTALPPEPANGRANAGAAVYEPRQPELPTAPGASTNIKVPGSNQSYPAQYQVRELSDVQPSHSGITFRDNPKYALVNDRDYANPANQAKVIDNSAAGKFDPSYHLTDNPDATNGPIVIDSDGHALAGNGRAMILQRVYKANPDGAAQYRMMLANKSPQFGVDPMAVLRMKEPVLVRQIADEDLPHSAAKQNAITDFNKVGTAQLTPSERAIADSRRVSQDTLDAISTRLAAAGPDASLADALQGASGTAILDKLIQDGVVSPQERAALATDAGLTPAAKERIGKLATGRFFRDPAQMDSTPPAIRSKLEAIAAPLARVDGIEGWDLTPHVQQALDLLEEARTHDLSNVMDAVSQSRLFGEEQYSPRAIALAEQLKSTGARALFKQVSQYANDARAATGAQQSFMAPVTSQQAFREALGR